jgi:hypothetical protein
MVYIKGSTTDNPVINLGKLGFVDIRDSIRDFFEGSDVFTDFDFEGSALSTLIDVLSYNSTFYSYYANMVANESFLDTATKRDSIGSLVKPLSYVPVSKRGARTEIEVSSSGSNVVVYGDAFFGGGLNWTPIKSYNLPDSQNTTIELIQGNRIETPPEQDTVDSGISHQRFRIPHGDIDTTTLKVNVNEGSGFNRWRIVDEVDGNVTGVTAGEKVFFLTTSFDGGYEIYFGDGVIGKSPVHDSQVSFDYLITAGTDGNGVTSFTTSVDGVSVISTISPSRNGINKESVDSIRTHAPLFFQTQGRAVTAKDYKALLRQERRGIVSKTWGGEDNDPPQYGRVFVSAVAEDGTLLTQEQKDDIVQIFRDKSVVSILPEFVDPSVVEVILNGSVFYNLDETSSSLSELSDKVISFVNNYRLDTFESNFDFTDFANQLLKLDTGLIGETLVVYLRKQFGASESNPINAVSISFSNPLVESGGLVGSVLRSNNFTANINGNQILGYLRDDGAGNIRHYSSDGTLISLNVGSVNANTGNVQIDGIEFISNFYVRVRPKSNNVNPKMGIILTLVNDIIQLVD